MSGHVASGSFGLKYKEFDFIQHAFEVLPVVSDHEARIALNMLFDQFFGLRNYQAGPNSPLASIAMNVGEEYGRSGPLYAALELYAKSSIKDYFPNLSIEAYLNLPKEMINWLLEISEHRRADKAQTEQDIINRMNAAAGQNRQA